MTLGPYFLFDSFASLAPVRPSIMATMLEVLEDSKSVTSPLPSYKTTPSSVSLAGSIQCTTHCRPSVLSLLRTTQKQKSALSRICDLVSPPGFTPSSVTQVANTCAATLPPAVFSHLLQTPNIEGHAALYWAIVNNQQEAFSIFAAFIPQFSSVCCSDLCLACMVISDQELFTQLNLGCYPHKDELLRRSLGCPPDEVEVHKGDKPCQFVACMRIRMFQKRLRIRQEVDVESVANGRIWRLQFHCGRIRCIVIGLSRHKLPAPLLSQAHCGVMIESHKGKPKCATQPAYSQWRNEQRTLHGDMNWFLDLPIEIKTEIRTDNLEMPKSNDITVVFYHQLGNWVIDDNTEYVDCDGTLHVAVEMTL
ncbi:uncharacterized protein BJ212DRAFT_1577010 [Suillus subaureus]|uniref:Uncharacterized protein n=1 Tax=Suillus subaureus TaxID=48587 RepID=A0A9P7JDL3_9AGAM|nr:uncharacterized protein BJ212DRAFT_1577010 [Suillus subaureus]KAG1816871.1 hypothetical protein BJ212DRAFT_1577010 [Suillus subaureus]